MLDEEKGVRTTVLAMADNAEQGFQYDGPASTAKRGRFVADVEEGPANTGKRVRIVSDEEKIVAAALLAMTDNAEQGFQYDASASTAKRGRFVADIQESGASTSALTWIHSKGSGTSTRVPRAGKYWEASSDCVGRGKKCGSGLIGHDRQRRTRIPQRWFSKHCQARSFCGGYPSKKYGLLARSLIASAGSGRAPAKFNALTTADARHVIRATRLIFDPIW
jgi:hypothetical protein